MPAPAGFVDVYGLPVGMGGVCVRRTEAHLPTLVVLGVALAALPPLLILAIAIGAAHAGVNVFGAGVASITFFALVIAALALGPTVITRPALRRWATYETRYEISPKGVRVTYALPGSTLVHRGPDEIAFAWDEILADDGEAGVRRIVGGAAIAPWLTRTIRLRPSPGRPRDALVISGTSDWLNPWPAVPPYGLADPLWAHMKVEDLIVALMEAFAARYAR